MTVKGSCHCGATQFTVARRPASVTRCTCSFCSKRGHLYAHYPPERFKVTQQVGELKAAYGMPPADPAREAQQIARLRALAEDAKLDPEFAEKFLNFVIAEVVRHHEAVIRQNSGEPEAHVPHPPDTRERSIHT